MFALLLHFFIPTGPGTLCVSETQIILRILLLVIDDVAVITQSAEDAPSIDYVAV